MSHLTIDKLTVRQVMVVLELLIEKVRSVGGQLCVSAANGKIKTAVLEGGYWRITFEQENTFVAHDLMRCQTFSGGNLKAIGLRWPAWRVVPSSWARTSSALLFRSLVTSAC